MVKPSAPVVTPLAGLTTRAGAGTTVSYAQGTLGTNALPAVPAGAFGAGLTATYFPSADLTGTPISTVTVPNLDITGKPAAVGSTAVWSARYTGTLTVPSTGELPVLARCRRLRQRVDRRPAGRHLHPDVRTHPERPDPADRRGAQHQGRGYPVPGPAGHRRPVRRAGRLHLGWQVREDQLVAQAAAAARGADAAVVVASAPASEGWDRRSLALPADQDALISAVAAQTRGPSWC